MNELRFIYEKMKDKYDLVLTNTFALNDGYTIDVPVIRGFSLDRRFDLYKEEDLFVFSVERCVSIEKYLIESISSPKKSILIGFS